VTTDNHFLHTDIGRHLMTWHLPLSHCQTQLPSPMPGGAGMSSLMVAVLEFSRIPSLSHSGSWERPNNMAWTLFCSDVSTLGTCQARQTQFRFQARHSLGSRPDTHSLGYTLQSLYVFVHTKLQGYLPLRFSTNLPPGNCPTLGHR